MPMTRLEELKSLGFQLAGRFTAKSRSVRLDMQGHHEGMGVYAFVVGETVRYLGETSDNLLQRVSEFSDPAPTQTTNVRVNKLLRKEVSAPGAGGTCEVWFLPESTIEKGRMYLELGGGRLQGIPDRSAVKRTLISRWDPLWNRR